MRKPMHRPDCQGFGLYNVWDRFFTYIRALLRTTMYLSTEAKKAIFTEHGGNAKNTGAAESQIALFTKRIDHLTEHLKLNKKDHGTEKALLDLVGKRKQILNYLRTHDIERYRAIIGKLGLRK